MTENITYPHTRVVMTHVTLYYSGDGVDIYAKIDGLYVLRVKSCLYP